MPMSLSEAKFQMCSIVIDDLLEAHFCRGKKVTDETHDSLISLVSNDPHEPSTRPCETCRKVTAVTGKAFWCLKYALQRDREVQNQLMNPQREFNDGKEV